MFVTSPLKRSVDDQGLCSRSLFNPGSHSERAELASVGNLYERCAHMGPHVFNLLLKVCQDSGKMLQSIRVILRMVLYDGSGSGSHDREWF